VDGRVRIGVEKAGIHPHGQRQIQPSLNEKQRLESLPAVDSVALLLWMFGPPRVGQERCPSSGSVRLAALPKWAGGVGK
jgi:hypothetical protein